METPHHGGVHTTPTNNRSHHHSGGGGSGGGREDCWSEGATAVLIEAWGDRYLQLSRGNLRQKDWKDVADAVNDRQDTVNKPRKTDVQCKNRIDTIKKKYKLERSKPGTSQWPFFTHLDDLIGANVTPKPPPLPAVTFTVKKSNPNPNPRPNHNHNNHSYNRVLYSGGSSSKSRRNSPGSTGSSHGGDEDDDDDDDQEDGGGLVNNGGGVGGRKKSEVGQNSADGEGLKDLAKAILSFGEIYERIESSKQEQIIELERQRMEFTKDLEFKRMQMFMEAQLELHKAKRPKYAPGSDRRPIFTMVSRSAQRQLDEIDHKLQILEAKYGIKPKKEVHDSPPKTDDLGMIVFPTSALTKELLLTGNENSSPILPKTSSSEQITPVTSQDLPPQDPIPPTTIPETTTLQKQTLHPTSPKPAPPPTTNPNVAYQNHPIPQIHQPIDTNRFVQPTSYPYAQPMFQWPYYAYLGTYASWPYELTTLGNNETATEYTTINVYTNSYTRYNNAFTTDATIHPYQNPNPILSKSPPNTNNQCFVW